MVQKDACMLVIVVWGDTKTQYRTLQDQQNEAKLIESCTHHLSTQIDKIFFIWSIDISGG